MKLLHSADWHLDAPLSPGTDSLREQFLQIPDRIAALCRRENCDLLLLSGDLFDGAYTQASYRAVYSALAELDVPVFIAPGNHDFCGPGSPYLREVWPENVHIFTHPVLESVALPELDCMIWGAGYTAMDCPPLLQDFQVSGEARWHIAVLHGDATQANSPYCPVNAQQLRLSGLDYLALGHIHKGGSFRSSKGLCAWPGCPMGHGYDETGEKGALIVTLDEEAAIRFVSLGLPRFFDEEVEVSDDAAETLAALLPPVDSPDFYRLTLRGYAQGLDLEALVKAFPQIRHLELRDRTLPEPDLWSLVGQDSLEGVYFGLLHDALDTDSETLRQRIRLATRISRQILDGQEVQLP